MSENESGDSRDQGFAREGKSGLSVSREEAGNRSSRPRSHRPPGTFEKLQWAIQGDQDVVARWFIPVAALIFVLLIVNTVMHLSRGEELDTLQREVTALRSQAEASNNSELSAELDGILAQVEGIGERLDAIDELNSDLQALQGEVARQNDAIETLGGRMDELEQASSRSGGGASPAPGAVQGSAGDGGWVVNLITVADSDAAEQFRKKLADAGVEARVVPVTIDDRNLQRVVVPGFESFEAAADAAPALKNRLALSDDPWITRE